MIHASARRDWRRRSRRARERGERFARERGVSLEQALLAALAALTALLAGAAARLGQGIVPSSTLAVVLLLGALQLRLPVQRLLEFLVAVALAADVLASGIGQVRIGTVVLVVVVGAICDQLAATRTRVGVPALRGESMLAELRDSLRHQGDLPELPPGWHAESALVAAGSSTFGGDFVVAACRDAHLELVVVDVSGKGLDAGTRALVLSGALGGLLGAVPAEDFLHHANEYLLGQGWEEGFATAIHLTIDLVSGRYFLTSAGHPPAAQFAAGSGHWSLVEPSGPVLGLIPHAVYRGEGGVLGRGDALLLYTDGVIEVPGRDLSLGVDKLLGEANRLVVRGFAGGADRLLRATRGGISDDRALVLVWRTG